MSNCFNSNVINYNEAMIKKRNNNLYCSLTKTIGKNTKNIACVTYDENNELYKINKVNNNNTYINLGKPLSNYNLSQMVNSNIYDKFKVNCD